MNRVKEKIIIVLIIIVTIFLAFTPMLMEVFKEEEDVIINEPSLSVTADEATHNKLINITIKGEIKESEWTIQIPYGYTYGYVISKIRLILNDYSVIDNDKLKDNYYEDIIIYIGTIDYDNNDTPAGVININTASKDELISLYGIGDKRADRIIVYRNTKKIESFEELKEIIEVSDEIIKVIKEQAVL